MYTHTTIDIRTYRHLSRQQQQAIHNLLTEGASIDNFYYDADFENPDTQPPFPIFYLLYKETTLAGILSLSLFPDSQEHYDVYIYSFVHPNFRRKGFFTHLLENSTAILKNISNLLNSVYFPINKANTPWISEKLQSLPAFSYDYSEYILKKQLTFPEYSKLHTSLELEYEENEYGNEYSLWLADNYIGGCLVTPISTSEPTLADSNGNSTPPQKKEVMISQFGIIDAMQGQGYGTTALQLICLALSKAGFQTVSLQVSSTNKIAHSLYLNCGFQATDELQYYNYTL